MSSSGYKEERIGQRDQIRKSTVLHPTGSHLPATRVWPLALALVKPASGLGSLFTTWHWHRQDEGGNSEEAFSASKQNNGDAAAGKRGSGHQGVQPPAGRVALSPTGPGSGHGGQKGRRADRKRTPTRLRRDFWSGQTRRECRQGPPQV